MNSNTARLHSLSVARVIASTADSVHIELLLNVKQAPLFSYQAGQFLTFELEIDGIVYQRSYSMSSSPQIDERLRITVKRIKDGVVSNYLNDQLQPGDTLNALPPAGRFIWKSNPNRRELVAFAAGSGITPIYSIIRSVLHEDSQNSVVLFYANQNHKSCIFYTELNQLQEDFRGRITVHHYYSRPLKEAIPPRRLNRVNIADAYDWFTDKEFDREFYLCGPEDWMHQIRLVLDDRGVDKKHIHSEKFVSTSGTKKVTPIAELITGKLEVDLDGDTREIDITSKDVILNRVALTGLEPPHNCMSGICGVCMARLEEGKVIMEEDYALTEDEKADNLILTCQAHIASEKVKITYL